MPLMDNYLGSSQVCADTRHTPCKPPEVSYGGDGLSKGLIHTNNPYFSYLWSGISRSTFPSIPQVVFLTRLLQLSKDPKTSTQAE